MRSGGPAPLDQSPAEPAKCQRSDIAEGLRKNSRLENASKGEDFDVRTINISDYEYDDGANYQKQAESLNQKTTDSATHSGSNRLPR